MSSLNRVTIIGNLGADPEVRRSQDGKAIVNLNIATSETWRDKNSGERREKTEWHRVVIFSEGLAKVAEQYLKKGSKVYLSGALQTRKWTDQTGVEKYSTEIVLQGFNCELIMLDGPSGDRQERAPEPKQNYGAASGGRSAPAAQADFGGDDIPFGPEWR